MENIDLLIEALDYIEKNLTEQIKTEEIAKHLYVSKSKIEKLFRYFNNISIRDYIIRRRMSLAALDISNQTECSILDIGIKYGYGSNEAFSRAFESVWHTTPSDFRKNPSKYELFPGYKLDREILEDEQMKSKKNVDISNLYDCIKERRDCYMVLGDIKSLIPINDISHKAGDLAIITALSRMEEAAGENDIVFRVGGDEFVILTDSPDEANAAKIRDEILSHNGESIEWEGRKIPLSMFVSCMQYSEISPLRYSELFTKIQTELNEEHKRV